MTLRIDAIAFAIVTLAIAAVLALSGCAGLRPAPKAAADASVTAIPELPASKSAQLKPGFRSSAGGRCSAMPSWSA